jgi:hypothetical protein
VIGDDYGAVIVLEAAVNDTSAPALPQSSDAGLFRLLPIPLLVVEDLEEGRGARACGSLGEGRRTNLVDPSVGEGRVEFAALGLAHAVGQGARPRDKRLLELDLVAAGLEGAAVRLSLAHRVVAGPVAQLEARVLALGRAREVLAALALARHLRPNNFPLLSVRRVGRGGSRQP